MSALESMQIILNTAERYFSAYVNWIGNVNSSVSQVYFSATCQYKSAACKTKQRHAIALQQVPRFTLTKLHTSLLSVQQRNVLCTKEILTL